MMEGVCKTDKDSIVQHEALGLTRVAPELCKERVGTLLQGEKMQVTASKSPSFKSGNKLKESVNS